MGELIGMHGELGISEAKRNWIRGRDLNGKSTAFKNTSFDINSMKKRINTLLNNLNLILTEVEMTQLKLECNNTMTNTMENHEIKIEKEHRPLELSFNERALVILTQKPIPEDIRIGLSFGWKFLFPYATTDQNIHQVLAELEQCIDETISAGSQPEAFLETAKILREREDFQENDTIQWLCFIALRTKRFFNENKDIFATRSDKGGHTVVIDLDKYENALHLMLSDTESYEIIDENPLEALIEKEKKIMKYLRTNLKTKNLEKSKITYEPNTKQLPKFYGLPKVHKEQLALRPITAMQMAPGFNTGKIVNEILSKIFPRSHIHVRDSYDMVDFCDSLIINEEHELVSFDVVKMYTSIPRQLVKEIVLKKQDKFLSDFGIATKNLHTIIDFLLNDCTIFTALGNIYKQKEGLPMGGCISTALARVVMDEIVTHLHNNVGEISFIKVFVDDTIAAMKRDHIEMAKNALNNYYPPKIQFTAELENDGKSINFLNLTLTRDGNFVSTNWYRKIFASGRLLNYYSSHKRTTIIGTAKAFIRTVLKLSDPEHFLSNKPKVKKTLRDNSFPETVIINLMNSEYTLMTAGKRSLKKSGVYKVYPQAVCKSRQIKRNFLKLKKKKIIYAESTRNTKINFVTTRKTKTPQLERTNTILSSKCVCGKKHKITSTKFNENGMMAANKRILTNHTGCSGNTHAFRKVVVHKGLFYRNQTNYLLRYIKWKHKGSVINTEFTMPNYHFAKLLSKVCKKTHK